MPVQSQDPFRNFPDNQAIRKLRVTMLSSLALSRCNKTMDNYNIALNHAKRIQALTGLDMKPPFTADKLALFVAFMQQERDVEANTINSYLRGLRFWQNASGFPVQTLMNPMIAAMIKGHSNKLKVLVDTGARRKPKRRAITFPMLAWFRCFIENKANLGEVDKKAIITAATCAFYGSFRMGELLSSSATTFDQSCVLLVKDVKFIPAESRPGVSRDMFSLHVKSPKILRVAAGDAVPLFSFPHSPDTFSFDPVSELTEYLDVLVKHDMLASDKPLFRLSSRNCLTKTYMNKLLKEAFQPLLLPHESVLGHSFRAGLSSHLKAWGFSEADIMGQGRWQSEAYIRYCRLPTQRKFDLALEIAQHCSDHFRVNPINS